MPDDRAPDRRSVHETSLILVAFTLSGAAALIYEVTWSRALALVLGSTVYAISTMLSTFMAGLAIGAYLAGLYCDRGRSLLMAFAVCELGIGVFGLLSIPIIYELPRIYLEIYRGFHEYPTLFFLFQVLMCVAVMLVPTMLMGATFPIVSRRITRSIDDMGRKVARAYSYNTVGAVVGSLAAGFFLIPSIGLKETAMLAAALNTLVAVMMMALAKGKLLGRHTAMAVALVGATGLMVAPCAPGDCLLNFYTVQKKAPGEPYEFIEAVDRGSMRELYHAEFAEGDVRAYRAAGGELVLQVGGKLEGTTAIDLPTTVLLAFLPVAAHPAPRSLLAIGLGAGATVAVARKTVPEVEVVEINPGVVEAVRRFGLPGLMDGLTVHLNDARNHLLRPGGSYDIITSEPSYPTEAGVSGLFTREFYQVAAARLNPGGVFAQWLPYYMIGEDGLRMMVKTFGSVFPYARVYAVERMGDIVMIGSRSPLVFGPDETSMRVAMLSRGNFKLHSTVLMGPQEVLRIASQAEVPVNTDDRPLLEFLSVRSMLASRAEHYN